MADLSYHGHCFVLALILISHLPTCAAQSRLAGMCAVKEQNIVFKDSTTGNSLNVMLTEI